MVLRLFKNLYLFYYYRVGPTGLESEMQGGGFLSKIG